jgi:DNA gyrase/topoisomerase IV subunit A
VRTTARGEFGLVTSAGRMLRMSALELPTLPPLGGAPSLSGGAPLAVFADLPAGEEPLTIVGLDAEGPGIALGTAHGVVKRVTPDHPARANWEVIALKDGDRVVGAAALRDGEEDLVFVTSDAQLLRFSASSVRPQGRAAGGMAGIRLNPGASVVFFGAVDPTADAVVVTSSGASDALPGTQPGAIKVTPYAEYPPKGRGTGGVRAHRFLRGEDALVLAWVGPTGAGQRCGRRGARASGGVRQARRLRHGLSGRHRRDRLPGALRTHSLGGDRALSPAREHRCDRSVAAVLRNRYRLDAWRRCGMCKRFYLGPGSLIAEATASRRDQ